MTPNGHDSDQNQNNKPEVEVVDHPLDKDSYFWTRCNGGWIAGVCQSMAPKLGLTPNLMRIIWLVASLASFGTGVLLYLACAVSFPNVDELEDSSTSGADPHGVGPSGIDSLGIDPSEDKKILGVCVRLGKKLRLEVAIVRVVMILLFVGSLGITALAYLILHFVLPKDPQPMR